MLAMLVLMLGLCILSFTNAVSRPSFIKPCSRKSQNFDLCALKSAEYAIPFIIKGDRQLKIPSFTPFKISLVELQNDEHFRIKLKDISVYGLDKLKILSIKTDFDKRTVNIKTYAEKLDILADYEVSGRLLAFPLEGRGPCKLSMYGGRYEYEFQWDIEKKNGIDYAKISKVITYDYTLDKTVVDFQNLFNGDKLLGTEVNKVLNENWMDVNKDLKKPIVKALLAIYEDIAAKIYSTIPFNELVID